MRFLPCLMGGLCLFACAPPAADFLPAEQAAVVRTSTYVVDAVTQAPIEGARVELVGTPFHAFTDAEGGYHLPARAGFDWIRVRAPGYLGGHGRREMTYSLWPDVLGAPAVDAVLAARRTTRVDSDALDDPDLRPEARAYLAARQAAIAAGEHLPISYVPSGLFKQAFEPPPVIRLYRRGDENDSCVGRVDIIPLEEYVRGVVPSEWISSWHTESLRAGAIAARTYAWSWILRGGKYDCADLDDTTRSQVYRENRIDRVTEAVDSTAGVGVMREGAIITTEYSAENGNPTAFGVEEPLCAGEDIFGHGRGMCQWGTQRWASQRGETAEWMVEHYYPGATTTEGGTPEPRLELSQRLERLAPQNCASPASTFDCADFVRQGWSVDLFDLFVGQGVVWRFVITNAGGAETPPVEVQVEVPGEFLAIEGAQVAPGGAMPPFGDSRLQLEVPGLGPGGTTTVELTLRATGYSPPTGAPVRLRSWIRRMGDAYDKPTWDGPPVVNEGQTFNGGDLRQLTEFDVYAPDRWTWMGGDPALYEGWRVEDGQAVPLRAGGLELVGPGPHQLDGPYLPPLFADAYERLVIDADEPLGGRVRWRGPGQRFDDIRSLPLDGGEVRLSGHPEWRGDVEQLQLFFEGSGIVRRVEVMRTSGPPVMRPDAAALPDPPPDAMPGPGPRPDAGQTGVGPQRSDAGGLVFPDQGYAASQSLRDDGCHCEVADTQGPGLAGWAWLMLLAGGVRRRRRRHE